MARPGARGLLLAAAVLATAGTGCATTSRVVYEPPALRAEIERRLGRERAAAVVVPFEIGPDLERLAHEVTRGVAGNPAKLEALALALSHPADLRLRYDASITATAEETLARGGGDCLSLTSVFVAMARSVGLPAFFVDARGVQQVSVEGNLVIDHRHVVAGYGPAPAITIVDFDRVGAGPAQYRALTDLQALARFYNNLGFVALRERRNERALDSFRLALELDPEYAAAHNNAAIALLRLGYQPKAMEHLLLALRHDPNYAAAMMNLAGILERDGRLEYAKSLRSMAASVRVRDPLWRVLQGQEALARGDAKAAAQNFEAAVRLDRRMLPAWLGLAEAEEALGNGSAALRALDRALKLAPQDEKARALRTRLATRSGA